MARKTEKNRIGVEFTTNEGYQVIVLEYKGCYEVQVMFLDEHKWITWTSWGNLKKGVLKNPFHPSVCGIGYLGVDKNNEKPRVCINGQDTREYTVWKSMMHRCYNKKFHEKHPTYEKCIVWERWHNYSLFLEDMPKIQGYELWLENDKYDLNKDMYYTDLGIETNEKIYSLETCRFIHEKDNYDEMMNRRRKRKEHSHHE